MDVRKWTERQTDKVWELCQHSDRDICPACVADAFAPTITKLVEALRHLQKEAGALIAAHEIALRQDSGNTNIACLQLRINEAKAALAELEKP